MKTKKDDKKAAPKKADKAAKKEKLSTYVLLDRSGSMRGRWAEALGSINAYVAELKKDDGPDDTVTVAVFDGAAGLEFDVVRDRQLATGWQALTDQDATPRGMTPLLDAVMRIVALAEKENTPKTVLVIMTDGEENNSRETTRAAAKAALDQARARDWGVVFLGADFDAFEQARDVGGAADQVLNMTKGNFVASGAMLAGKSMLYRGATGQCVASATMSFTPEDRDTALGKLKK